MNLHVYDSVTQLNEALITFVIEKAQAAIAAKGQFNFVLTGGKSPVTLYQQLSTSYAKSIDWSKVFFFFGDERNVLASDPDYNGKMAKEHLFDNLATAKNHIFYIDTTLTPEEAAKSYKSAIDQHFNGNDIQFDLILLGMGDDAHTASIFPGTDLVKNKEKTIAAVWVEKLKTYRISFTAPLINAAKNIAFITFGPNKAEALAHVINDTQKDYTTYPAQLIEPANGNLDWFIDTAAYPLNGK